MGGEVPGAGEAAGSQSRAPLAFTAAALLGLVVVATGYGLYVRHSVLRQAESETQAAVLAQARIGAMVISDHQGQLLNRLVALASRALTRNALATRDIPELRSLLAPLAGAGREFLCALVADGDGRLLARVPTGQRPGGQVSGLPPARAGTAAGPGISSLVALPGGGQAAILYAPITGSNGALLGWLAVRQRPDFFHSFFRHYTARPGRRYYIFDQRGQVVVCGPPAPGEDPARCRQMTEEARLALTRPAHSPASQAALEGNGAPAFAAVGRVAGMGWNFVVLQDYDLAMSPFTTLADNILLFLIVLVACMSVIGALALGRYRLQQQMLSQAGNDARRLEVLVSERTKDLRWSSQRYRSLLEDLPDVVYEVDAGDDIVLVSQAVRGILGYEPQEMVGRPWREYVSPEDHGKFDQQRARVEQGGAMSIVALRHRTKDGQVRWLSLSSRGKTDARGELVGRRGVARDVTQQVLAEQKVSELSGRLIQAQESERKRLALDLHDEMGQLLSALKIGLQAQAGEASQARQEELRGLIDLSQKIMDRVRAMSYRLRPAILDNFGLAAAIEDLGESLGEAGLIQVELDLGNLGSRRLGPDMETALFRFVQEALNNAVKHSGSPRAKVEAAAGMGVLSMRVTDYGRGIDAAQAAGQRPGRSLGLPGMRERLGLLGGTLEIQSSPQGTILTATVPLEEEA